MLIYYRNKRESQIRLLVYKCFLINHFMYRDNVNLNNSLIEFFKEEYLAPFKFKIKENLKKSLPAVPQGNSLITPNQIINFYDFLNTEKIRLWNFEFKQLIECKFVDKEVYKQIEINVINSFIVYIKAFKNNPNSIKLSVCGIEEQSQTYNNLLLCNFKPSDKSSFKLFRKIERLFDDRINLFIKILHCYSSIPLFISKYSNLFNKHCYYCRKISKFDFESYGFYPPLMIANSLENDTIYHEDCFQYVCVLK